ncbi:MAG TPA: hypothetical protein DIW43_18515 [Spongiibacteraceae bacterium]|nr:hypothetical protein [Spongiibacteraceae bacterium]MBN51613.1 hypothetical protein [Spongiibacteraceae bacterium]HCS29455.1 hypothetical protein [Spongiibacteraceae bacterium]
MPKRQILKIGAIGLCCLFAFSGFVALGNWQLDRRVWKLELIQKVDERVHASATPAPSRPLWPTVSKQSDEYRHVIVTGHFLADKNALVVGASTLGSGYWVLTPFQRLDGSIVYVNRGFIPQGVEPAEVPSGEVEVSGLLRINEPMGSTLRANDPSAGRWYSRDVKAIASAQGLSAAPYFIDSDKGQPGSRQQAHQSRDWPVGGLTVIQFHNSHLVYALTWYGLAAMMLGAFAIVVREERRTHS